MRDKWKSPMVRASFPKEWQTIARQLERHGFGPDDLASAISELQQNLKRFAKRTDRAADELEKTELGKILKNLQQRFEKLIRETAGITSSGGKGAKRIALAIAKRTDTSAIFADATQQRLYGEMAIRQFIAHANLVMSAISDACSRTRSVQYRKDAIYELSGLMRDCQATLKKAGHNLCAENPGEFHTLVRSMVNISIALDINENRTRSEAAKIRKKCLQTGTADKAFKRLNEARDDAAEASDEAER
jgi:hypothetical protein